MQPPSIEQLTDGQRACLRLLWHERLKIAEIGFRLGISEDTVDQRLRGARRRLSVNSSIEAARLLAEHEASTCPSPVYPVSDIPSVDIVAPLIPDREDAGTSLRWPLPRWNGEDNDLSIGQRLFWSFALAAAAIVTMVMALAMGESLTRLSRLLR